MTKLRIEIYENMIEKLKLFWLFCMLLSLFMFLMTIFLWKKFLNEMISFWTSVQWSTRTLSKGSKRFNKMESIHCRTRVEHPCNKHNYFRVYRDSQWLFFYQNLIISSKSQFMFFWLKKKNEPLIVRFWMLKFFRWLH